MENNLHRAAGILTTLRLCATNKALCAANKALEDATTEALALIEEVLANSIIIKKVTEDNHE